MRDAHSVGEGAGRQTREAAAVRIVLVCGSRDRAVVSYGFVEQAMPRYLTPGDGSVLVIHGGAGGTDEYVDHWCHINGIHTAEIKALWDWNRRKGNERVAGPIRNGVMAALKPAECLAFPGGRGTADMVRRMEAAGVPVTKVSDTRKHGS